MANQRPTPQRVAALKIEIARRYKHQSKVGKRTRSMAAIRLAELTRWLDDLVGDGTELEPSEWSAGITRIFVHHLVTLSDGNRKAADWMAAYCPWINRRDRESMITEANHCPLKWSADKLAWKIRLSDAKRTELRITTIGAFDVSKDERMKRRKIRQAELQKALRARRKAERQHHIG